MALIQCDFSSRVLGTNTSMKVILPDTASRRGRRHKGFRTLLLLHGLGDDHSTWCRRTSIERYVSTMNLAVVMPDAHRSFYADMDRGLRYWTFISEEVPAAARSYFPLSDKRSDNFVAGLSMGGYGAFKLALRHPERYAGAASLSGALDIESRWLRGPEMRREYVNIFGPRSKVKGSDNDLMYLAARLARSHKPRPRLYQCCGTSDWLLPENERFRDHARNLRYDLTWEQTPGDHDWGYWNTMIQNVLKWMA